MPRLAEELEKMLDEILAADGGLTGWEIDFVEDMDARRGQMLTARQAEKLEAINEKVNR